MKIFVTGATGFIGSHFVNQAISAGHEVVAQRRSPISQPRIPLIEQPRWVDSQLDEVQEAALSGVDALVHLAAHTPNVPYDTLENCLQWNLMAPLVLFRKAVNAGVDRLVVAGSCFEYGLSGERYEFIPVDAPLFPTQTYPASKAAASIAFAQFAIEHRLRLSIHRIFQVYGEGEAENRLWPSMRKAALAGQDFEMTPSEQVRDFVEVSQVAASLLDACSWSHVLPGCPVVTNLGSGQAMTVREFAETWWKEWKAKGTLKFGAKQYRDGEVMRFVPQCDQVSHA